MRLIICLFVVLFSVHVQAASIKDKMVARLPQIEAHKAVGDISENPYGYLDCFVEDSAVKKMVEAENKDRKTVYTAMAKKHGLSAEQVGKRRAAMLKKKSHGVAPTPSKDDPLRYVPVSVANTIKTKCTSKWPDNFRMQKYCRNEEAKAWSSMNQ